MNITKRTEGEIMEKIPNCKICGKKLRRTKNMGTWNYLKADYHEACLIKQYKQNNRFIINEEKK